jgi:hypothetical protein
LEAVLVDFAAPAVALLALVDYYLVDYYLVEPEPVVAHLALVDCRLAEPGRVNKHPAALGDVVMEPGCPAVADYHLVGPALVLAECSVDFDQAEDFRRLEHSCLAAAARVERNAADLAAGL